MENNNHINLEELLKQGFKKTDLVFTGIVKYVRNEKQMLCDPKKGLTIPEQKPIDIKKLKDDGWEQMLGIYIRLDDYKNEKGEHILYNEEGREIALRYTPT